MKPGPRAVAQIILSTLSLDAPPQPLDEVVYQIIEGHPEWQLSPAEKARRWSKEVETALIKSSNRSIKEGKHPSFAFNSVSSYKIQGACFIEPLDPPEVRAQKLKRGRWIDYYKYLRDLSPESFEKLCVRALSLLGVPRPILTPYRADQGIDFFGKMSLGDLTGHGPQFPVFESDVVIWLVGQAKHYFHSKISTPDIRELAGSTVLGRSRDFPQEGILQELKIRTFDPVVMLFFTTGEISTDGWSLCRKAGIAAMDGEMFASFLADKEVGLTNGDSPRFDSATFETWLAGESENSD